MTDNNKQIGVKKIDGVMTRGSTDIYSAVEKAVEIIESREDKSRNPAIMLFTDGQPNRSPPGGEIFALK